MIEERKDDRHKAEKLTRSEEGGKDMPPGNGGEDASSAPVDGNDNHLKDEQKITLMLGKEVG